jgi:hypothetical protein
LNKNDNILSVASGLCVNELFLIDKGYKITCADMGTLHSYDDIKKIFPDFKFILLDILNPQGFQEKFDAIICLGADISF